MKSIKKILQKPRWRTLEKWRNPKRISFQFNSTQKKMLPVEAAFKKYRICILFVFLLVRDSEFFSSTCSARSQNAAAIGSFHPCTKTVFVLSLSVRWLVGTFHFISKFFCLSMICWFSANSGNLIPSSNAWFSITILPSTILYSQLISNFKNKRLSPNGRIDVASKLLRNWGKRTSKNGISSVFRRV